MRLHALIALCLVGCGSETLLRIDIPGPGTSPSPASLRVTLAGSGINVPPRTITPISFPGTIIVRGLGAATAQLCVLVEALAADGTVLTSGTADVLIVAHRTNRATIALDNDTHSCAAAIADLATGPPPADLATPPPPADLAGSDAAAVVCPSSAMFCDDFESGTIAKWSTSGVRYDMASLNVQSAIVRHGNFALHAAATGTMTLNNIAEVEYDFLPTMPPLAIRANIYSPRQLYDYTTVMALYDSTVHGFAIGGDNTGAGMWVMTENQAMNPDHYTDMVPATGGQWHCVELVIDAAGMVSFYVDDHLLLAPFARVSPVAYSVFVVGIERTVLTDTNVFVDDVAVGPQRLYCP